MNMKNLLYEYVNVNTMITMKRFIYLLLKKYSFIYYVCSTRKVPRLTALFHYLKWWYCLILISKVSLNTAIRIVREICSTCTRLMPAQNKNKRKFVLFSNPHPPYARLCKAKKFRTYDNSKYELYITEKSVFLKKEEWKYGAFSDAFDKMNVIH